MKDEKAGTAKVPETTEEARVLDDEELTRIVGGTGNSNDDDNNDDDDSNDSNDTGDTAWFSSPGPSWD